MHGRGGQRFRFVGEVREEVLLKAFTSCIVFSSVDTFSMESDVF